MKPLATVSTLAVLSVMVWAQPYRVDLQQTTQPGTEATPAQQQTAPSNQTAPAAGQAAPQAPAAPAPVARPIPTCPNPAPTQPASARKWKGGQAEYQAFTAAAQAPAAQKAQAFANFVQKYPNSDYKVLALIQEMAAQTSSPAQAVETAETILKTPGADADAFVRAYSIISYFMPQLVQPNDPQMQQKLNTLYQAAYCGNQMLEAAQGLQPNAKAQSEYIYNRAIGFVALQDKNYPLAKQKLMQVVQFNSKDPLAYYWLGIAQLSDKPADFNTGIFSLARAADLAPQAQALTSYFQKVYDSYHGSDDGIQDVKTAAANNTQPPAGFKILSKIDIENAQIEAENARLAAEAAKQLPPANTFAGIEARLKLPDKAAPVWKDLKGQTIELDGVVVSAEGRHVDVAVGPDAISKNQADVRVMVAATPHVKEGEKVSVQGVATRYVTDPTFLLTLEKGSVKHTAAQ